MDRAQLRKLISAVLPIDSDFMSFCSDYFTHVNNQYSSGMDRQQKITYLLDLAEVDIIYQKLISAYPKETQNYGKKIPLDSSRVAKDLSQLAQDILIRRPRHWEYRLLSTVLSDEMDSMAFLRQDLDLDLTFSQGSIVANYFPGYLVNLM